MVSTSTGRSGVRPGHPPNASSMIRLRRADAAGWGWVDAVTGGAIYA